MRRLLLVTMAVSLSAAVLLHAADDLVLTRFTDYLESLRTQAGIPGLAVSVSRAVEGTWERGFGNQDIEHGIAVGPITPFHADGTTQIVTAAIILRCVEEGRLSLDDRAGDGTIRQLLSHTSAAGGTLSFAYRPERLDALAAAVTACTTTSLRVTMGGLLEQLGMYDSVPGPNVLDVSPGDSFGAGTLGRFRSILDRLAKPYAVDSRGRALLSQYVASTLTPASGLISTVRDLARFDLALRQGALLRAETLSLAWTAPVDANGQRLPHGLGWFVQTYNGERIVWQFGVGDNASSSMIVTVPGRGLTLVLMANSQGLSRPFSLSAGDVTVSPFARLFLSLFIR
jgi:CubicO group peptidase (beta-lactamase class C family)